MTAYEHELVRRVARLESAMDLDGKVREARDRLVAENAELRARLHCENCGTAENLEVYCCQHGDPDTHKRVAELLAEQKAAEYHLCQIGAARGSLVTRAEKARRVYEDLLYDESFLEEKLATAESDKATALRTIVELEQRIVGLERLRDAVQRWDNVCEGRRGTGLDRPDIAKRDMLRALRDCSPLDAAPTAQSDAGNATGVERESECNCGRVLIPALAGKVSWYHQLHGRKECWSQLPDEVCWCGLRRSEHVTGHAETKSAEPRISVSEAHLDRLRAEVWEEAVLVAEDTQHRCAETDRIATRCAERAAELLKGGGT